MLIIDGVCISNSNISNSNIGGVKISAECEDEIEIIVDGKTLTKVKAKNITLKGNVKNAEGTQFVIDGQVNGNVDGTNVTVNGNIEGDVDGTNITVKGTVSGDIDGTNVIVKN